MEAQTDEENPQSENITKQCPEPTVKEAPQDADFPAIIDSISQDQIDSFRPFHERYFEKKYCTRFSTDSLNLDTCVKVHTNKICVIFLSEKHSLFAKQQTIQNINFKVSNKVDRLRNVMSGKSKKGAQILQPDSVLCYIETSCGESYPVHAGVYGKLLEINSKLIDNPNLLIKDLRQGFLAIILPELKKHTDNVKSLKSVTEYDLL